MTLAMWVGLAASYLLGAIPTSYLVGRVFRGIDLRSEGSKNLGATNLYRVLGWKFAVPVALFDVAKGAIPVLLFAPLGSPREWFAITCGVMGVLGHVFSVFVHFKGGKGVATAAGVMLGLAPAALGISFAVWAGLVYFTGYVSLGSIVAATVFPLAVLVLYPGRSGALWLAVGLAALIVWMHRGNIQRLLNGTENRFGRSRAAPAHRP